MARSIACGTGVSATAAGRARTKLCPALTRIEGSVIAAPSKVTRPSSTRCLTRVRDRSEEHTSELQSHSDLVCRLLLEKKKQTACRRRGAWSASTHEREQDTIQMTLVPRGTLGYIS